MDNRILCKRDYVKLSDIPKSIWISFYQGTPYSYELFTNGRIYKVFDEDGFVKYFDIIEFKKHFHTPEETKIIWRNNAIKSLLNNE